MPSIRFARISFERKLAHYTDERNAIERRKDALLDVIDYDTDVNSLLEGTERAGKTKVGQWYFGDVTAEGDYIAARLGKLKEETRRQPDDEVKGFVKEEQEDTDVSFFVIDLENSVMAYEFRKNVGEKAPFWIIEAVFNEFHAGKEEISISPLVDKEEVRHEIRHFRKITRVRFANLTPTNPNSTHSSAPMDDFLESGGIDNLVLDAKNEGNEDDEEGIRLEEEPLLDGGLSLAEEGYGRATIHGEDENGDEVHVTTDEKPIQSEVDLADSDELSRERLLSEIREALETLED